MIIDTHVLLWLTEGTPDLGMKTREAIDGALADDRVCVSAISFWEIAMLARTERLEMVQPSAAYRRDVIALGIAEIPVTGEIGIEAAGLADLHQDPADRLIIATATLTRRVLVTADRRILAWRSPLRRLDARV